MPNSRTFSLFVVAVLAFTFISYGFAKDADQIVEGRGAGVVVIGATKKQVEASLGQPTRQKEYSTVYFVDYSAIGIQVVYKKPDNTVDRMYFFNKASGYEHFTSYSGQTARGVRWEMPAEEVLSIYGEPQSDFKEEEGWRRIVFEGVDFYFEKGKLVRICVPGE